MSEDDHGRELRSFGRRRGRKPSAHQEKLLRDLLPKVAVDFALPLEAICVPSPLEGEVSRSDGGGAKSGAIPPTGPSGHLPLKGGGKSSARSTQFTAGEVHATPSAPCSRLPAGESQGATQEWLEIGFGGGEHLLWQARANPTVRLIGCEPFEDGVIKVLTAIEAGGLDNIRVHMGDARDVLRALPEASIARAFILFPDPWPKRKHQKRRLINAHLLDMLARVMTPGAELRFGTDIGDYARSALMAFRAEPRFCWQAASPQDWRIRPADWPETRYESKAQREGRQRYYFRFVRV